MENTAKNNGNEKNINVPLSTSNVKIKKASEVPEEKLIKLNPITFFEYKSNIENDKLNITLSEADSLSPSVYTKSLTLKEFIKMSHIFKVCKSIEEVKMNIDKLVKYKRIKLIQIKSEEIIFELTLYDITIKIKIPILLEKKG